MSDIERMEAIIHDAIYPGSREDRMTWPRGIFDAASALTAAGFGHLDRAAQLGALMAYDRECEAALARRYGHD